MSKFDIERYLEALKKSYVMPDNVKLKDNYVNFSNENKVYFPSLVFDIIMERLDIYFIDPELYITAAHDAKEDDEHSKNSVHYDGLGLDLRTWNLKSKYTKTIYDDLKWRDTVEIAWMSIAKMLPEYVFILHLDDGEKHIHMQFGWDNIINPKDKKWGGDHKNIMRK